MDTVFHKIIRRELPATVLYEDAEVMAIADIHPKAPTHVLFLPKTFVASVADITPETTHLPGLLIEAARKFAVAHDLPGYKLNFNVGKEGGQEVPYLHLHLLSEKALSV